MEKKSLIYVYRYMWSVVGEDGKEHYNVRVLSGIEKEHLEFSSALENDDKVASACREYLHEIDVANICCVETVKVKKENK